MSPPATTLSGRAIRRALVVAVGWMGDGLWQAQTLAPLAGWFPEAELEVACRPGLEPLFGLASGEVRVTALRHVVADRRREPFTWGGLREEARALARRGPWDLVLDLCGNRYSALFVRALRPRLAVGFGSGWLARLVYDVRARVSDDEHLALRPLRVAQAVAPGAAWAGEWPAPAPAAPWPEAASALGLDPASQPIVLAPGAGWAGKRSPPDRLAALAGRLASTGEGPVVVVGSKGEQPLLAQVAAGAPGSTVLAGAPLLAVSALCARARLFVGHDSGPTHLAAAAGAPVVALFSSSNPQRARPLGPRVTVLRGACPFRPEGPAEHCHGRPAWPCPATCWDAVTLEALEAACRARL